MKQKTILPWKTGLALAGVSLAVLAGVVAVNYPANGAIPKLNLQEAPISRDARSGSSYAPVVKKVAPSVVSIFSTKTVRMNQRYLQLPDDPVFRRFFGPGPGPGDDAPRRQPQQRSAPRKQQQTGLGSGVIVTSDGYILTNNHVVDDADEIKVRLSNDHDEYTAKVVGTDAATDIAILKIEAKGLPAITITDSEKLEVGDIVLAIGNPFGVGQTVTMGIVSATGRRSMEILGYENFIQTDAPINPGNSGGALVDAEGRLVGINTAILSPTGGNNGIGFAVPANLARFAMEHIITDGRVTRGFIGVLPQPVTPDLAKAFNLGDTSGALIASVEPKSPGAEAGLKDGDVVVEFNGKKIEDHRHLRLLVSQTTPGTKSTLKLIRDGKPRTVSVTLAELPVNTAQRGDSWKEPAVSTNEFDGLELSDLDNRWRRQFNVPNDIRGAIVLNVEPDSVAYEAGLRQGDVILEVNRQPVRDTKEVSEFARTKKGETTLLRVWSGTRGTRFLTLRAQIAKR